MRYRNAATMALAKTSTGDENLSIYRLAVSLEIPITNQAADAIGITSLTFSELYKEDYAASIKTINGINVTNDNSTPRLESTFNSMFHCKVKQVGASRNYLQVNFVIKTKHPLGQVKDQLFHYLRKHKIWLRRSPGPISKTNLLPL